MRTLAKERKNKKPVEKESKSMTLVDVHRAWQKEKQEKGETRKKFQEFKKICVDFNKELVERMFKDGVEINMGSNLGYLSLWKSKTNLDKLRPDYQKTKELNALLKEGEKRVVYHTNDHSGGFHYKSHWAKGKVKNILLFKFQLTHDNRRYLARLIKAGLAVAHPFKRSRDKTNDRKPWQRDPRLYPEKFQD